MTRLEEIRCALNSDKGKKVQTVSVRLQAGAKRAAGTQRPKEAHTIRNTWERTLSRRRVDITLWLMTEEPHRSRRMAILKAHPQVRNRSYDESQNNGHP